MRINQNISAMNTYSKLTSANGAKSKSLEKLSSGLRINRAGDDAAGLAISEKMRGQIGGLNQAVSNAQDGISLIQTAEGALSETHSILQRMRELSVQSATDTNSEADRVEIQKEMDQLGEEIGRITDTTQFNTKNLIDGSMGKAVNAAVANVNTSSIIKSAGAASIAGSTLISLQDKNDNLLGIAAGDKISITYMKGDTYVEKEMTVAAGSALSDLVTAADAGITIEADGKLTATAVAAGTASAVNGLTIRVTNAAGNIKSAATESLSSFVETTAAEDKQTKGSAVLQIGANSGQNMTLSVSDMGAAALGVKGITVKTQAQADVAIKVIDSAIQKVSSERSKLGATQNRLDHTINNLTTTSENLSAAESRIRDVDMAKEMMQFTKNNILSQAATSMLAQANQMPQSVLQLLQ